MGEHVADESAMFNVRQASSPDGITPTKVIYALSASQNQAYWSHD